MDESVAVFSTQAEMPTSSPVERNETQDGLASELANSKSAVKASKDGAAQKGRGQKSVKETTKSVKKAPNSLATKRTVDKTTKPKVSAAKKVATAKATRAKSPIKKKAVASKVKKQKKYSKEVGVKKASAKPSAKTSKK